MRHDYLADTSRQTVPPCLSSIYFGGGTPSQLTVDMLKQLTQHIFDAFDVDADAEITIEMNPDDVTPEYVQQLRSNSIISMKEIGSMSFKFALLAMSS